MKLYLSSYKLGNEVERLKELLPANKKVAFIPNALDFAVDLARRAQSEQGDIEQLEKLGLTVERIDLREYFGQAGVLREKINECGLCWVRGGNVFVLRQAMKLSGFDEIIKSKVTDSNFLYGAYSAGVCVLAPTLHGYELVDDSKVTPYGDLPLEWNGLNLIDYAVLPHFQSEHEESEQVTLAVEYMKENRLPYKTLRDGEVIIIE